MAIQKTGLFQGLQTQALGAAQSKGVSNPFAQAGQSTEENSFNPNAFHLLRPAPAEGVGNTFDMSA